MAVTRVSRRLHFALVLVFGTAKYIYIHIYKIVRCCCCIFCRFSLFTLLCTQHVAYGIILPKTHISHWTRANEERAKDTRKNVLHVNSQKKKNTE